MTGSHFYKKLRQAAFSLNMNGSAMADVIPCGTPGGPPKAIWGQVHLVLK
jgi:hypothetical protein